jgi:hypothetical protein
MSASGVRRAGNGTIVGERSGGAPAGGRERRTDADGPATSFTTASWAQREQGLTAGAREQSGGVGVVDGVLRRRALAWWRRHWRCSGEVVRRGPKSRARM